MATQNFKTMKILAIETSCDDTGIALLEAGKDGFKVLLNIVSSQIKIHKKWGGVVPTLAKREHQKNLPEIFKKTGGGKIDLIGVTASHGLEPCLWMGVNFAKELAKKFKLPIVPVHHIEAHILANFIENKPEGIFPAVALVVSGGHTGLVLMKGIGKYKLIGETRDDAAGECFDKAARILGLGYPGGPIIAAKASGFNKDDFEFNIDLPRPMMYQKNYDFSFSGLKTAVLYDFKSRSLKVRKSQAYIKEMCFKIQQAVIDVLIKKTLKAAQDFKVKSVILGGGVVANHEMRKRFEKDGGESGFKVMYPSIDYCTDNAAMTAAATYFHRKEKTKNWKKIEANANLKIG